MVQTVEFQEYRKKGSRKAIRLESKNYTILRPTPDYPGWKIICKANGRIMSGPTTKKGCLEQVARWEIEGR